MSETAGTETPEFRPPAPQPLSGALLPHQLLWALLRNPLHLWQREYFEELVTVVRTPLGSRIVLNDPMLIKRVLVDNAENYLRDGLQQRILLRMTGRSLFMAEGDDWRFQRKILAPFFTAKALAAYLPAMSAAATAAADSFRTSSTASLDMGREMAALTVEVLGSTIFRPGLGEPPAAIAASVRHFTDVNGPVELGDLLGLPQWLPGARRLLNWRATARVRQRARRMIAEASAAGWAEDSNVTTALLSARDPQTGQALDVPVIESNVSTLIGAGSDTVAIALTWSLFLISHAPHVREAVEAEVDQRLEQGPLTLETLDQLVWTQAIIEEALRLYPPAPLIGRMARSEDTLGKMRVARGTTILISPWVLHRHARLWKDPDLFQPERFLPGQREHIPRFAYLPFGGGPRQCLGMGFAMQEATVILATLLSQLRFFQADKNPVRLCQRFTLQTETPLLMRVEPRRPT